MITQVDSLTSGAIGAFSHPLTVQVLNQGPGIWGNVATGLITAGAAIAAVMLTHRFTLKRERQASEDRLQRERYFIATELVFLLERFAQQCVLSATESGDYDNNGQIMLEHYLPKIGYAGVTGDWRSLPHALMYRISELPVLQEEEGRKSIHAAFEDDTPYDGSDGLHELNNQSCRLGLRAIRISRELRRTCGMPDEGLSAHHWSAWRVLSAARGRLISAELLYARSHHKTMFALSQHQLPVTSAETEFTDRQGDVS
ncbi:hypothetical protein HFD91_11520 [Enterobacteriaceae bacterium EKM102V]|uniref:hypothetical protein n=1 Tax=Pantoea TaxID=53335 RepID=UPI00142E7AE5|nr:MULTISPECIES: hypothetical protein [Pantoea]KAF6660634.1 hypothetical protein HFD91_11520 [Enterobacteriaceae bacterium EKM102V]KAF6669527.1 hypothetical protein HFD97_06490 [Pantoea sp. EKM103V]